jgi:hypothetical protein
MADANIRDLSTEPHKALLKVRPLATACAPV